MREHGGDASPAQSDLDLSTGMHLSETEQD